MAAFFWQLHRRCMRVEDMAGVMAHIAVTMVGMLSDMLEPAISRADTLVSVLAVDVATILCGSRAATRALQAAHIIGTVAVAGEAVTGIRPMDIPGSATAIHITGLAITATALVGAMIRTTDTIRVDTTLTATDTRRT